MQARQVFLVLSAVEAFLFAVRLPVAALYRIQVVGLDAFQLVVVGAVLELSVLLFEMPTGAVADLHGRRRSVVTGFALIGAGFLLEVAVPTLAGVLASQVAILAARGACVSSATVLTLRCFPNRFSLYPANGVLSQCPRLLIPTANRRRRPTAGCPLHASAGSPVAPSSGCCRTREFPPMRSW